MAYRGYSRRKAAAWFRMRGYIVSHEDLAYSRFPGDIKLFHGPPRDPDEWRYWLFHLNQA